MALPIVHMCAVRNLRFENCAVNAVVGGSCPDTFIDLGIAIGSAVSVAGDDRIDNGKGHSIVVYHKTIVHEFYLVWLV